MNKRPNYKPGTKIEDFDTPCLVLDVDVMNTNMARMEQLAKDTNKELRPHAKTHKCSKICKLQLERGAIGICTAKVSEAEVLAEKGINNILITSPVVTDYKVERMLSVREKSSGLMTVVDNIDNAKNISNKAGEKNLTIDILLALDPGMGRCGVTPENSLKTAKEISDMENLNFKGIQFYCGHLQHIKSYRERKELSLECMKRASDAFSKMEMAGLNCEIFSGTGTGTHDIDCNVKLITDMQVGSYTIMDVEYIEIGSLEDDKTFSKFPPALTILSSVISANHSGHVTIDAGLKGMYRDGAVPRVISNEAVAIYEWFGDEQGKIICGNADKKFPLGSKVKLIASHCDPTINLYDCFHVVKNGELIDFWEIDLRGCSS